MKKSNVEYYKEAVKKAGSARATIISAKEDYERKDKLWKDDLSEGILGEVGYNEKIESAKAEMNEKIESAQRLVLNVADAYSEEMAELSRLDGDKIDDATMKLLNSGINLTHAEWQELANKHADNAIMSRILKERYEANRPAEEGTGITIVQFGQTPAEREKVFGSFVRTLAHSVNSDYMPKYGGADFDSRTSYWNHLAKDSLKSMKPFEGECFDSLDTDFSVGFDQAEQSCTVF